MCKQEDKTSVLLMTKTIALQILEAGVNSFLKHHYQNLGIVNSLRTVSTFNVVHQITTPQIEDDIFRRADKFYNYE